MQKIKKYIPVVLSFTPLSVLADQIRDIPELIDFFISILNLIVPLLMAVAVVVFLWGVIKYITAGGDEEKRKEARNTMIWGIVGLFVMVAVWGLVNVLISTFGFNYNTPSFPQL